MKKIGIAALFLFFQCSNAMHKPFESVAIIHRQTSQDALLKHQKNSRFWNANVKNYAIDCTIATLFFLGSGIPGVSKEVQTSANISASVIWLGDSVSRLVASVEKSEVKQETLPPV